MTEQQKKFVFEIVAGRSPRDAFKAAYPAKKADRSMETERVEAYRLMRHEEIREAIEEGIWERGMKDPEVRKWEALRRIRQVARGRANGSELIAASDVASGGTGIEAAVGRGIRGAAGGEEGSRGRELEGLLRSTSGIWTKQGADNIREARGERQGVGRRHAIGTMGVTKSAGVWRGR
jgi:hypothetical protein